MHALWDNLCIDLWFNYVRHQTAVQICNRVFFGCFTGQVEDGVPRLLINREKVGELEFGKGNYRDAFFQGDCDDGASALTGLLGIFYEGKDCLEAM